MLRPLFLSTIINFHFGFLLKVCSFAYKFNTTRQQQHKTNMKIQIQTLFLLTALLLSITYLVTVSTIFESTLSTFAPTLARATEEKATMAGHDVKFLEWGDLQPLEEVKEKFKWDIITGSDVDIAHQASEFRSWLVSQGSIPIQFSTVSSMIPVLKLGIDGSWGWNRNLQDPTIESTCNPINTFRWHWSEDGSVFVTNRVNTMDGDHFFEAVFPPPPGVNLVLRSRPRRRLRPRRPTKTTATTSSASNQLKL